MLATATLGLSSTPGFDSWGWVLWGRELAGDGAFSTAGYPSWKPLPALLDGAFAAIGPGAVPALWLVLVRASGLVALVLAARLAARLGGRAAAVLAVVGLATMRDWWTMMGFGESEPMLVALVLGAVDRHLAGRPRQALALGFLAALLRPETWPFLLLYAAWVAWHSRPWARATIAGALLLVPVLWFGGDWLGSGSPWTGSRLAKLSAQAVELGLQPVRPHAALVAAGRGLAVVATPFLAGALYACVARSPQRRTLQVLTAGALLLIGLVAAQAVIGYPGLGRFSLPAGALLGVVGALGLVRAAAALPRRAMLVPAGALVLLAAVPWLVGGGRDLATVRDRAVVSADTRAAAAQLERTGTLSACGGRLAAAPPAQPALADALDRPVTGVAAFGRARLVIAPVAAGHPWPEVDRWLRRHPRHRTLRRLARDRDILVYEACARRPA
ncbi:MAG: hypothetical protein QOE86_1503 [Solirubrobacteraceae bacterium]|nr:hypothetical protein [Solirubrobacteraceae bacterium]